MPTTSRRSTPKARKPRTPRPASQDEALRHYEEGLKAFGRKDFPRAITIFESIIKDHPSEPEVCDRARIYINISKAATAAEAKPKSADDFYYQGVMAANQGRLDRAAEMFEQALKTDAASDKSMYGLATVSAQMNDRDKALQHLTRAIQANRSNKIAALNDSSFDGLREDREFTRLLGLTPEASE